MMRALVVGGVFLVGIPVQIGLAVTFLAARRLYRGRP
jgi:hypothetical protein